MQAPLVLLPLTVLDPSFSLIDPDSMALFFTLLIGIFVVRSVVFRIAYSTF